MRLRKQPVILYLSSFPPRQCGIATFTQDLTNAMDKELNPGIKNKILAINDNGTSIYNYPKKVIMQIYETKMEDYLNTANEINKNRAIKLVNIQHEYGLYGGDWGDYILPFLEIINKPIITTFHTVLPKPKERLIKLTKLISEKSKAIIVMTENAKRILVKNYNINKNKISVIPHGVHHIPFPSKSKAKNKINLSGHIILSTFGMLNKDKGIEYAIEALPEIIKDHPNILYLIIGATHPVVRKEEGEAYRNKLKKLVNKLNLKDNVKFYDKYLELHELIDYLKATDIYISPSLNPEQAVSGTISYALSCACPIVSTNNQYAKDVINDERGILVKFKNSLEIKNALLTLINNKKLRNEMKKNSYFYSRHMTWQNVALSYFNNFNEYAKIVPREIGKWPPINLTHIKKLTDDYGIIQFAIHTKPDIHSGYCLDDNARALLACAIYYDFKTSDNILNLIKIYLNFIKSTQKINGKFYNFIGYNKNILEHGESSEDSYGRAIWALGYIIYQKKLPDEIKRKAEKIFIKALPHSKNLISPRAIAFTILGLYYIVKNSGEKKYNEIIIKLSNKLIKKYLESNKIDKKWNWFEDFLTYSNYKMPECLFRAYELTKNKIYLNIAKNSINFLNSITFEKKYFSPIGQDGWYFRNGKRAYFDQQPEDSASAVEGLISAYEITKNKTYLDKANIAYEWFLGKNHLNQMVYDEATGGSYDGLGKNSINFNQGAESTLSYLLARLAMERIKK